MLIPRTRQRSARGSAAQPYSAWVAVERDAGRLGAPPRFERAITWSRLVGALAVVTISPFLPNLGPVAIGLLAGSLVVSAVVLHRLSGRMRSPQEARRLSWITFGWDVIVVSFAILLITPDPNWPLIPLIGVLLIITTAFRLGDLGALLAASLMGASLLVIALWRTQALGLAFPVAQIGFDLLMYGLTALLTTSMLREVGGLRTDVETLRRSDRERTRLLEHEREARSAAERTMTHLGAVERISESMLRDDSVEGVMQDALDRVVMTVRASVAAILTSSDHGFVARASHGLVLRPRSTFARDGDLGHALDALAQITVVSHTLVPLSAGAAPVGVLYLGFDTRREITGEDRSLLELIAARLATALERAKRLETERRARAAAESAAERAQLLLEAADAALGTADVGQRFARLARLAVPKLADSCAIQMLRSSGRLETVALAAVDAERERDMWMVAHRYPRSWTAQDPLFDAIRTAEPRVIEHLGPDDLAALTRGPEHLRLLLEREVGSWMGLPILDGGTVRGAIELFDGESGRAFTDDDLATARLFALRVAAAPRDGDTME